MFQNNWNKTTRYESVGFSSDGEGFRLLWDRLLPNPTKNNNQTGMSRLSLELQRLFVKARVWSGKLLNIETQKKHYSNTRARCGGDSRPGPWDIRKRTRSDGNPFSPTVSHVLLICAFSVTESNPCFDMFYELILHGRLVRED